MKYLLTACLFLMVGCASNSEFTDVHRYEPEKACLPVTTDTGFELLCDDGSKYTVDNGLDGADGAAGQDGVDGADGIDGSDGVDGIDGTDGLIVDIIDPCGQETQFDEVILELSNGDFLAYFAGNSTTTSRLAILDPGVTYKTTDGTNCKFKIDNGVVEL